jgi:PAS domain S-box-containing protein
MDGAIEYINRKAELVFGFPHSDIPNMDRWWAQAYPDEAYRKEVIARYMGHVYEALEKGGEIAGEEYLVTCKDGAKKTCYIYGVIAGGKVFVMFDDITARVETEKALRASETDLRRTLEQAPVSIAIHALDGDIEFINRKFSQTFGYKPEDIPTFSDWTRQAYPDEGYRKRLSALWKEWVEKSIHTGLEMEGIEVKVTCKDGSVKTVFVTGIVTPGKKVIALLDDITSRVQAERALRERESLYRSLIETTGTGYVVLDGRGRVLDANREYVRLSGHADLKEILGRSVLDWAAPHSQARAREAVEIVVRDGRVSNFEVDYLGKGGEFTTIEINATAVTRDGVQQILGLCRDVSARSKTEAQLRESESLYRALIETTGTGYVVADSDFKVVDANAEYARLAGYSKVSEIIGRSILDWTAPEFKERNASGLRKCFREGRLLNFEVDYQGKTGRITPVEGSVTIVSRNGVPHILSLSRDVTERKKAEARLRDSESLYRALIETTGTGYVVISSDGIVLDANQEYVRLSGHSDLKEIIGRPVTDWTAPDKVGENAAAVAECARNGHIFNFETDYISVDGARTPIEINATVVQRAGIPQIHTICRDITQRRKDAADLKALNQDLEKRVQERTAELTKANVDLSQEIAQRMEAERGRELLQQELIQSQKMEVVGRLSAGIAHDFNNILVAISGYAEFLIQTLPEGAQAREDLGEIVRETERGAMLTRQLMAIGRKQPVELKVLSVNAVAGDSARMLKRLVGSNMNLETRLDPEAGQIKADAGQVSQVLMNLVVNARDAMSEGGKLIISTGNEEITERQPPMCLLPSPGKYVTVSVSDTGTGMDPDTVCHIFDPFFTTKAEGKGTGLGLSTVYGIVHQSGGGIDVKTAPGQGTTFKIYFPRA